MNESFAAAIDRLRLALTLAATLALALSVPVAGKAQEPDGAHVQSTPVEAAGYRRVFVPADRPEQWPTADERYLPVDRKEFDRLIQAAAERRELEDAGAAQISSARYVAHLEEDELLKGSARFDVRLIDEFPQILPLTPWNLAVHRAWWAHDADQDDALLSAWKHPGFQVTKPGLLVQQSGTLEINWELSQRATQIHGCNLLGPEDLPTIG